jgi:16S rRNA G966 N2-methylase RsmD
MNHFPVLRYGNKQSNIKFFEKYLPKEEDIMTVAEPFAGSFAVIRNKYFNVNTILCADNDLGFQERIKNIFNDLDDFDNEKKRINKIIDDKERRINNVEMKEILTKNKYFINDDFIIKGVVKKLTIKYEYNDLKTLYNRIKWFSDYKEVMELLKDDEKAFIFLDPPYFMSHNSTYYGIKLNENDEIKDNTYIYLEILNYFKNSKCKIMMILNKSEIMKHLFKDYYKDEYGVMYGMSKNKEKLMVLTNYPIENQ